MGTAVRMHGDGCSWPRLILWGSSKKTSPCSLLVLHCSYSCYTYYLYLIQHATSVYGIHIPDTLSDSVLMPALSRSCPCRKDVPACLSKLYTALTVHSAERDGRPHAVYRRKLIGYCVCTKLMRLTYHQQCAVYCPQLQLQDH